MRLLKEVTPPGYKSNGGGGNRRSFGAALPNATFQPFLKPSGQIKAEKTRALAFCFDGSNPDQAGSPTLLVKDWVIFPI